MVSLNVWISIGWSLMMVPCCSCVELVCLLRMLHLIKLLNTCAYKRQKSAKCLEDMHLPSTKQAHISRKMELICIVTSNSTPRDEHIFSQQEGSLSPIILNQ